MKKIFLFLTIICVALFAQEVAPVAAVQLTVWDKVITILQPVITFVGSFLTALMVIGAIDPTNKVVKIWDKISQLLKFFSFDKYKEKK